MTLHGKIVNGAVVLDENVKLPEGAKVKVELEEDQTEQPPEQRPDIWRKLYELGKWAETQPTALPPDLAENHDHYIHGTPKRKP
ncbi:MAG TPA: hypothetical protein VEK08_14925 [Planctomycetota bacterium]|nr:hypothetical protein [Planctomycetota bacterium]